MRYNSKPFPTRYALLETDVQTHFIECERSLYLCRIPRGLAGRKAADYDDPENLWRPRRDLNPCYRRERAYTGFVGAAATLGEIYNRLNLRGNQ